MKRRISILLVLAMVLSVLNVGMSVSAAENYKNFLTVTGDSKWTKTNATGSTITDKDGALTISTVSGSLIDKAIGAYTTASSISPVYVAQYDVMLDYDDMGEEETGRAAVQVFDGAYRALVAMYKSSITAQNATATTSVNCTVESGKWYTITIVTKNGVMDLYRKAAGVQGLGEKLISDMAMKTNTANKGRFYAYTEKGTNITAAFKNIKLDAWSDDIPGIKATGSGFFVPADTKWTLTQSTGIASANAGVVSLKGNNGSNPKPSAAVAVTDSSYPVVTGSYKMNAISAGRMYLRFEDVGYRVFIQFNKDNMKFCTATATAGTTVNNVPSAVGTEYDFRLEVNSVNHTYSFARKTGDEGYVYIVKDQPMQGDQKTTAKKLVFGTENEATIDVEISSVSVENRSFVPVFESVYKNSMDSGEALSKWTLSGDAGIKFTAVEGVTLTSDGSAYKPNLVKSGIAEGLPMQVEFDYTLENNTNNNGFIGVQIWNANDGRGFVQIFPNTVKVQAKGSSGNVMNSYTDFFSTAGEKYRFRIIVGETTYSVYRKGANDRRFIPVAENAVLPTGHNVATQNIKFYMEKAGAEMTLANFDVALASEYTVDSLDASSGISVKYVCQDDATEGGKLYVAVYDGDVLEYVNVLDAEKNYGVENEVYIDYAVDATDVVKAFIWRDITPIAQGK